MNNIHLSEIKAQYEYQLLEKILPFWMNHSIDSIYGGYMTWLNRDGTLISTDKSVWMQGRGLYIFSKMYNQFSKNQKWLDTAASGYNFIKNYCIDKDNRLFFRMTKDGKPIIKRRYIFSDVFVAAGMMEYYIATKNLDAYNLSLQSFKTVFDVFYGELKLPSKIVTENRLMKNHSLVMIMIDLCKTMRQGDNSYDYAKIIKDSIHQIEHHFFFSDKKMLIENIGPSGEYYSDIPEGRLLNPGHAIETAWFILEEGITSNNQAYINLGLSILDSSLLTGWDKKYGGLYSFLDSEGLPPYNLEWDMKLWWPHNEAIIATLMAYSYTENKKYLQWFDTINNYIQSNFYDNEYGEWYGYLHRDNTISSSVKGCIWKGPFHVPRSYMYAIKMLKNITK
ncbi:MAG: AGE family epimerase/isomerase [Clostridiales bacterium]|nr:AGE family epimerase/isomerase [Clostridiales bacterium]